MKRKLKLYGLCSKKKPLWDNFGILNFGIYGFPRGITKSVELIELQRACRPY